MTPDYRRWIVANAWSESAGLGTTFALGRAAAPWIETVPGLRGVLLVAIVAIAAGVLLEGLLVGAAQSAVVARRLPRVSRTAWIRATMIGAGLAWTIGMIPSSVMSLQQPSGEASVAEPGALVQIGLAVGLGAITGPILGGAQWTTLRRHVVRPGRWLAANAMAWAVGMPIIFLGMDIVPWERSALLVALTIYAVCAVTGAAVGAVHGVTLLRFKPRPGATDSVET